MPQERWLLPVDLAKPVGNWYERETALDVPAGENTITLTAPSGYMSRVHHVTAWNGVADRAEPVILYFPDLHRWTYWASHGTWNDFNQADTDWVFSPGEEIKVTFAACAAGDNLYVTVWAYLYPLTQII